MAELPFPSVINFAKAVTLGLSYEATLDEEHLPRLKDACEALRGPAKTSFRFFTDLQGLMTIAGSISCEVEVVCQRCCENMPLKLHSDFSSTPDELKARSLRIEDKLDIVDTDAEGNFALLDFLEDCLLLELPYAPVHPDGTPGCLSGHSWEFGAQDTEPQNPFAVLKALQSGSRGQGGDSGQH